MADRTKLSLQDKTYTKYFDEEGYIQWVLPYIKDEYTTKEVDLIENLFHLPRGSKILDLCCGNARHAILLSKRGYMIKGLDASQRLIKQAKEKAKERNIKIEFYISDMSKFPFANNEFDGVFNFFSSFGFFNDDENINVLKEVSRVLKPQGKFLLETISRQKLIPTFANSQRYDEDRGSRIEDKWEFASETNTLTVNREVFDKNAFCGRAVLKIRLYSISEIVDMFSQTSLKLLEFYRNPYSWYSNSIERIVIIGKKIER